MKQKETTVAFALAKHGLLPASSQETLADGNLNAISIFENKHKDQFCLRQTESEQREDISNYLSQLYNQMGLSKVDGSIDFLDVPKQVEKMKRLKSKSISVPQIIEHGQNWMIMTFEKGTPLTNLLPHANDNDTQNIISSFLNYLLWAHSQDECLWDRWGANELYEDGHITFIDFDVDVKFPNYADVRTKCSFDLTVALRGCIQFSESKDTATQTIKSFWVKNWEYIEQCYNPQQLAGFMRGQADFYDDRYCVNQDQSTEEYKTHHNTNKRILELADFVEIQSFERKANLQRRLSQRFSQFSLN